MINFDRIAIDDGRHLPKVVIDEDASTAAGAARHRVTCSCGRMSAALAVTGEGALAAHLAHAATKTEPTKGPQWLPVGVRLALLVLAMLAIWVSCYIAGEALADGSKIIVGGAALVGFSLAFALMVAMRRYIAPTRV